VARTVPDLRRELTLDLVVANGENMAGGRGLTAQTVDELRAAGVDLVTSGNHVWDQRDMTPLLDTAPDILRPLNYPPGSPGRGHWLRDGVLVLNAIGRLFMRALDCPFRTLDAALERWGPQASVILVDFHAEATSEKIALTHYLDGRVSAVVGTHTHVPTADPRILPGGTAAVTDLGMVGPYPSVIGLDADTAVRGFLSALPQKFTVAETGQAQFNAVLVEVDRSTGRAMSIERVDRLVDLELEESDDKQRKD
jgi:metallophosphoesterase (TIGR00282 family)